MINKSKLFLYCACVWVVFVIAISGCSSDSGGAAPVSEDPSVNEPVAVENTGPWRLMRTGLDMNNDGNVDQTMYDEYDENGLCTRLEFEDSYYLMDYDENGRKIREAINTDKDGSEDEIHTYQYDSSGLMGIEEKDEDGDGIVDKTIEYTYDAGGRVETEFVTESNGSTELITFSYDSNGMMSGVEVDEMADGITEAVSSYTYTADGFLLSQVHDRNNDGVTDDSRIYTYNADKKRVSETWINPASIMAGHPYARYIEYEWDADGNLIKEQVDNTALGWDNGDFDEVMILSYDPAHYSRVFDMAYRVEVNPWKINYSDRYLINRMRVIRFENSWSLDTDGDGIADISQFTSFDSEGFPESSETDIGSDGIVDQVRYYTWERIPAP